MSVNRELGIEDLILSEAKGRGTSNTSHASKKNFDVEIPLTSPRDGYRHAEEHGRVLGMCECEMFSHHRTCPRRNPRSHMSEGLDGCPLSFTFTIFVRQGGQWIISRSHGGMCNTLPDYKRTSPFPLTSHFNNISTHD